jgi:hypothetical protein
MLEMKPARNIVAVTLLAIVSYGCVWGVVGGNPTGRLSDRNGTSRVLDVDSFHVATAITNAFESHRYRDMALIHTGVLDYTIHGRKFEGGYDLTCMTLTGAITNVALDNGRVLPYVASFYVETEPVSTGHTKVTVRTISSGVPDGRETGVHGGVAGHIRNIPPLRQEEENILTQISAYLEVPK